MPTPSRRTSKATASRAGAREPTQSSTPRKTAAKKTATKKTAARTTAARSAPARKSTARRTEKDETSSRRRPSPAQVARSALEQLAELTAKAPEGVTAVEATEDGWTVEVEVIETRRIPDSTDILATYEVQVDQDGELTGYRRSRRYARGRTGDD